MKIFATMDDDIYDYFGECRICANTKWVFFLLSSHHFGLLTIFTIYRTE